MELNEFMAANLVKAIVSKGGKARIDEDNKKRVIRQWSTDNCSDIWQNTNIGDDGENVSFFAYSYISVPESKKDLALLACNAMNVKYRWIKFCLDSDNDIVTDADAVIDADSYCDECMEIQARQISIMNKAYPQIMEILNGNSGASYSVKSGVSAPKKS